MGRKPLQRRAQESPWINTFEVAERHQVSPYWVRHTLPHEFGVVARKHGGAWWFLTSSVDAYFMNQAAGFSA